MLNKEFAALPFTLAASQKQVWVRGHRNNSVRVFTTQVKIPLFPLLVTHFLLSYGFLLMSPNAHHSLTCVQSVNLAAGTAVYLSTPRAGFLAGRFVFSNWDMEQLEGLKDQIVSEDLLKSRIRLGEQLDSATVSPQ